MFDVLLSVPVNRHTAARPHTYFLTGRVSLKILWTYIKAMGGLICFGPLMLLFVLIEGARVGTTLWLSYWTGSSERPGGPPHTALWFLGIYSAISGGQVHSQQLGVICCKTPLAWVLGIWSLCCKLRRERRLCLAAL